MWAVLYKEAKKEKHWSCCAGSLPRTQHLLYHNVHSNSWLYTPVAMPGNYLLRENNYDKRIKIAWNDGKHFVDRYVEKKGNGAVKKIEHVEVHRGGKYSFGYSKRTGIDNAFFPLWYTHTLQFTFKAASKLDSTWEKACCYDFPLFS